MKEILIVCFILTIATISGIYSGETIDYTRQDLGLENITSMNITGNISIVLYNFTSNLATIKIPEDAEPQSFVVYFNGYEEVIVSSSSSSSSGGSSGRVRIVNKPITNSQQENSSISSGESTTLPPADNQTPIIDLTSEELNKQTKDFFKQSLEFIKEYWIIPTVLALIVFLVWVFYSLFKKEEPQVEIELPKYITDNKIEFPKDETE